MTVSDVVESYRRQLVAVILCGCNNGEKACEQVEHDENKARHLSRRGGGVLTRDQMRS